MTTTHGLDGREMPVTVTEATLDSCTEGYIRRQMGDLDECRGVAHVAAVATGRHLSSGGSLDDLPGGIVRSGCCDAHGGAERAIAQVAGSWYVQAPLSVEDVLEAGTASLCSEDVYVVVRPSGSGRWVASLGIGSHTRSLRGSWASQSGAIEAGVAAWRAQVDADVAEITRLRGGTLAWGMPVQPRDEPVVIAARQGQSAYAALRCREIGVLLPGATIGAVHVAEQWINGHGTVPIEPTEATEWATVLWAAGHDPIVILGSDIVYVAPGWTPDQPLRPSLMAGARNVSTMSESDIVAAAAR